MMSLDDPGLCLTCGNEQGGCEPDARRRECESCGEKQVYGAEELMLSLDIPTPHADQPSKHGAMWPAGNAEGD